MAGLHFAGLLRLTNRPPVRLARRSVRPFVFTPESPSYRTKDHQDIKGRYFQAARRNMCASVTLTSGTCFAGRSYRDSYHSLSQGMKSYRVRVEIMVRPGIQFARRCLSARLYHHTPQWLHFLCQVSEKPYEGEILLEQIIAKLFCGAVFCLSLFQREHTSSKCFVKLVLFWLWASCRVNAAKQQEFLGFGEIHLVLVGPLIQWNQRRISRIWWDWMVHLMPSKVCRLFCKTHLMDCRRNSFGAGNS